MSDRSDIPDSIETEQPEELEKEVTNKGFQKSPKSRIYQVSEERFKELDGNGKGDDKY